MQQKTVGRKIFVVINFILMLFVVLVCLLPLLNVFAISLSSSSAVSSGLVSIIPRDITTFAYQKMMDNPLFWSSLRNSVIRVILGTAINMFLIVTAAFPLSLGSGRLSGRGFYIAFFMTTMLVSGGLIPTYLTIMSLGLLNNFMALILPTAVPVFNLIVMINFFRGIPPALEEAARIDGAGYWKTLYSIYLPCSLPAIATVTLFCIVYHWNEWFSAQIYLNDMSMYPLQSYLQIILNQTKPENMQSMTNAELEQMSKLNSQTINAAQIVISTIPILLVYPFLQKYFVTGLTLGGVKE